jgi:hypothetical protein
MDLWQLDPITEDAIDAPHQKVRLLGRNAHCQAKVAGAE